jgi:hypothetical protein
MGNLKNKKTIPTFTKPSTSLNSEHGRKWKNIRADQVQEGDLVANLGSVIYTQETCRDEVMIEAGYPQSREYWFSADEILFAFVQER